MKMSKKILAFFSLAVLLNPSTLNLNAVPLNSASINIEAKETFNEESSLQSREFIHEITAFSIEKNTLNLIINNIFKEGDTLFIDAYFLNTTENTKFETLENFNLSIHDANDKEVLNKTYKTVVIPQGLSPNHGRKILFPIEKEFFDLKDKDLSKITYKFTFDYI
ncbi:hypothetical protein [Clostridium sp. B9]|uniref:hypothetical protein n=1 Tax=Clostridium sp. B9 TaxID=3423224 RepID=UPI003D2E9DEF